jgi:thioredoxin-related protein
MFHKAVFLLLFAIAPTHLIAQNWVTHLDEAQQIASKNNQTIILVFQGSDWCAPCIKLDREVWSTDLFKDYAKDHYVMLQADFPRKKKNRLPESQATANATLAEKYNPNGIFPFVVVLDKDGNALGKTSYKKMKASEYIEHLNSFKS